MTRSARCRQATVARSPPWFVHALSNEIVCHNNRCAPLQALSVHPRCGLRWFSHAAERNARPIRHMPRLRRAAHLHRETADTHRRRGRVTVSARAGRGRVLRGGRGGRWWPPGGGARSTGKRIFQKFGKESGARYLRVATSNPYPRRQYLARVGRIMPRTPVDASAPSVREMTRANVRARPAPSKPRSLPCPSTAARPAPRPCAPW